MRCKHGCEVPFISYYDHNEPVNCWNCKQSTSKAKMKNPDEELIFKIKEENQSKTNVNLELTIENFNLQKKIGNYYDLLKILNVKTAFDNKLKKLQEKLVIKQTQSSLIERMIEEFNRGDTIETIEKQIHDTKTELFNYFHDFEEFILRKRKEHEELDTSLEFNSVNKEVEFFV